MEDDLKKQSDVPPDEDPEFEEEPEEEISEEPVGMKAGDVIEGTEGGSVATGEKISSDLKYELNFKKRGGEKLSLVPFWDRLDFRKETINPRIEVSEKVILLPDYRPCLEQANFHLAPERFRFAIWGIKSGKSVAVGAHEMVRSALAMPNRLSWILVPTYPHLQVAENAVLSILYQFPGLVRRRHRNRHEILLANGHLIIGKSAQDPAGLKGPNITGSIWGDEGSEIKDEAWEIARGRGAATLCDVFITSTPMGRNWLWRECRLGGMPATDDYGEFRANDRFVSHYPTWQFPWVEKEEIADMRRTMSKLAFDRELGAKFVASSAQVFQHIEEAITTKKPKKRRKGTNVMGVDLAKHQDNSAIIVMDPKGFLWDIQKWEKTDWTLQKTRIKDLSKEWKAHTILDKANAGSVMEEDLRNMGVDLSAVSTNAPMVKEEIIQALQIAFEQHQIWIPDPSCAWAPEATRDLIAELMSYAHKLTPGGRVSYSAPKGLMDDLVIALALANWGRLRGYAGGHYAPASVAVSKAEMEREKKAKELLGLRRPKSLRKIFGGRRSSVGLEGSSEPFWR